MRYSPRVLDSVMRAYGLDDRDALIAEAIRHDDGNRYLKRSELEAAAKALTGVLDALGIISDLDKTLIPAHNGGLPAESYPGAAALFDELERGFGAPAGDTVYVTARTPRTAGADVHAWLRDHGFPEGPIETGISGIPAVAEREKIADITRVMNAHPEKRFVLFGDSNHRDPEVYRAIVERFPDRVPAAFIHDVRNIAPARVEGLHLIDDYAEAAAILFERGVLAEPQARRVMVAAQAQGLDITDRDIDAMLAHD